MITGTVPPSALQAAPVTYEDRGEHRKAITAAIWSASPPDASQADERVGPGVTALQRMPSPAWTSATSRDSDRSAAFVTEYSGMPALGRFAEVDETLTMAACSEPRRCGSAARMQRTWLITLVSQAA